MVPRKPPLPRKTAVAKEYPGNLNRVLAFSPGHSVLERFRNSRTTVQVDQELHARLDSLNAGNVNMESQVMQPDYGRNVHTLD